MRREDTTSRSSSIARRDKETISTAKLAKKRQEISGSSKRIRTTLHINPVLFKDCRHLALDEGKSFADLVEMALKNYLKQHSVNSPRLK